MDFFLLIEFFCFNPNGLSLKRDQVDKSSEVFFLRVVSRIRRLMQRKEAFNFDMYSKRRSRLQVFDKMSRSFFFFFHIGVYSMH